MKISAHLLMLTVSKFVMWAEILSSHLLKSIFGFNLAYIRFFHSERQKATKVFLAFILLISDVFTPKGKRLLKSILGFNLAYIRCFHSERQKATKSILGFNLAYIRCFHSESQKATEKYS